MILHEFALSSASYRVRIALNLKGIAYESRSYTLRAGEQRSPGYLAINPAGLVPTLEVEGRHLTQSLAIIDYLEQRFPDPPLLPQDPWSRARALAIANTIACDIHPLNNLRVLGYLKDTLDQPTAAVDTWYAEWVTCGFEAVEALLQADTTVRYATGDAPDLADICIVPQVFNARRFDVDLSGFPRLVAVADYAARHPAFASAAPRAP